MKSVLGAKSLKYTSYKLSSPKHKEFSKLWITVITPSCERLPDLFTVAEIRIFMSFPWGYSTRGNSGAQDDQVLSSPLANLTT